MHAKSYSKQQHAPTKHVDAIARLRISEKLRSFSQRQHTPTRYLDATASSGALEKCEELQQTTARSDETSGCYCSPQNFRGIERVTASSSTLRWDIWMLLLAVEF